LKRADQYRQLAMVRYATAVSPSPEEVALVLQAAASGPASAASLVRDIPAKRQAAVFRGLVWLVKLGLLKVSP